MASDLSDLSVCGICNKPAAQWTFAGTAAAAPRMPGCSTQPIDGGSNANEV